MTAARATGRGAGDTVLSIRNTSKHFPGVKALDDVSIEVFPHEIVGLIGENGAGKSTLMRIMAGAYQLDSGEYRLNGRPVSFASPREAARLGVGMMFQEQSLLPNLTVGENIYLAAEHEFMRGGFINWKSLYRAAERQLAKVKADIPPGTRTSDLDFAARQMVELAKVLTLEERIDGHLLVLLDEPTSVLEQDDIDILFECIRDLRSRASFVFVSHRLDEVLAISDRIYVMKDGRVEAAMPADEADVPRLHRLMVGRGQRSEFYRESMQVPYRPEVLVQTRNIAVTGHYRDVSFELHAGEILAIAGVIGSGREALCRTLFGFYQPSRGSILIDGKEVRIGSPADAVKLGIGYIPRERRTEGLVLFLPVRTNMTLASLAQITIRGIIDFARERTIVQGWIDRLRIRTPSIATLCRNLSGGNQQKVVLAKWMAARSRIVILDHPTRGLDVGAKEEVFDLMRAMCAEGIGIILTADTLDEAIGLSHTILVMRDGEVTKRFEAGAESKPDQVALIEHMV